jgi:hypothetical protein
MCGTLKFGKGPTSVSKLGDPIHVLNPFSMKEGRAIWSGFAQQEKTLFWQKMGNAIEMHIRAEIFTEKNLTFKVPDSIIYGFGLRQDVILNGQLIGKAKTIKVITRPPMNNFERSIHHRWPFCTDGQSLIPYQFTEKDVVEGQQYLVL